jgi:hypothetical protein
MVSVSQQIYIYISLRSIHQISLSCSRHNVYPSAPLAQVGGLRKIVRVTYVADCNSVVIVHIRLFVIVLLI